MHNDNLLFADIANRGCFKLWKSDKRQRKPMHKNVLFNFFLIQYWHMQKISHNNITLTAFQKPKEKEIDFLKSTYNFHPLVIDELAHPTFHPKVENYQDHTLLIVRFPQFDRSRNEVKASEIDFIITKDELVLFQYNDFDALETLVKELSVEEPLRDEFFKSNTNFLLYKILTHLFRSLFPQLDHIIKKVDELEHKIFKGKQEELVSEISLYRREAIDFKRIVGPNVKILEEIKENPAEFFGEDIAPYFHELHTVNSRLISLIESQTETLLVLHETNESILSNKISNIMKVLTMFSVIIFPLTFFAAVWGMNVENMPLVGHPYDFWVLISMMGAGTFIMLMIFKMKKWI